MTDEKRKFLEPLARNLYVAFIAWKLGVKVSTAERRYQDPGELGELWYALAEATERHTQTWLAEMLADEWHATLFRMRRGEVQ